MFHMQACITKDAGQIVNDLAESMGIDYGPVLGILIAQALEVYGAYQGKDDFVRAGRGLYAAVCSEIGIQDRYLDASLLVRPLF